jgi:hypothetical protein
VEPVPLLRRYYEVLRRPAAPLAALRFLRLAIPSGASVFVSPTRSGADLGPGAFGTGNPNASRKDGNDRASPVPGEPLCAYAVFSDPGRTPASGPTMPRRGPRSFDDEGSQQEVISGLTRTASALAVYASSGGLPHHTQDSLPVAGQALPDRIGYP